MNFVSMILYKNQKAEGYAMSYKKTEFGKIKSGEDTCLYTFENAGGMQMKVTDYGASLVSVLVKDKNGSLRDMVLGYDDAAGYENDKGLFLGAIVGRNANRIGGAALVIDGQSYELCKNDHGNNLHSGPDFFMKRKWTVERIGDNEITFSLFSPHMDQGYPGNVKIFVTYTLTEENDVRIEYEACPDRDTILNMTNHSYFNVDGQASGTVLEQRLWIDADAYTEADEESIPTGKILKVGNTPMDFRSPKTIGKDIESDYQAIRYGLGYDHNYVLNGEGYRKAAEIKSERSGIKMSVYTDCPGMQLYTGNFLAGQTGKGGAVYSKRCGVCFESQYFPDAVHHEAFESPICKKGETYHTVTAYRFEAE